MPKKYSQILNLVEKNVFFETNVDDNLYFNINDLPPVLSYGKHSFIISYNNPTWQDEIRVVNDYGLDSTSNRSWRLPFLKNNSFVLFEFVDSNGTVIFTDLVKINDLSGTGRGFIWIKKDPLRTAAEIADGPAYLYVVGELDRGDIHPNGMNIWKTSDYWYVPEEYLGYYNVRSTFSFEVRKDYPNTSPIVFSNPYDIASNTTISESLEFDDGDTVYKRSYINVSASRLETNGGKVNFIELSYNESNNQTSEFTTISTYKLVSGSFSVFEVSESFANGLNPISNIDKFQTPSEFRRSTPVTFKLRFLNSNLEIAQYYTGSLAGQDVEVTSSLLSITGTPIFIEQTDNLLSGSLYTGQSVEGAGFEQAGFSSAYLRTRGYEGFTSASAGSGSGILMYSGSILHSVTDDYDSGGVGLELVSDSSSYFRFRTNPSELDIRANAFFVGNQNVQFISGSGGNIEISSSIFHLDPATNTLTLSGSITATAGSIGDFQIIDGKISGSNITFDANNSTIYKTDQGPGSDSGATFDQLRDEYYIDFTPETESPDNYYIKMGPNFMVDKDGVLIASGAIFEGTITSSAGNIGGANIESASLSYSPYWRISASNATSDPVSFISSSAFKVSAGGNVTGSQVLFTGGKMGGWDITTSRINSPDGDMRLTSSNPKITIGTHTIGSGSGIQLGYDGSDVLTFFAGEGANDYFKYVGGTGVSIKTDNFTLTTDGDITGSQVLFTGGKIAGATISDTELKYGSNWSISASAQSNEYFISSSRFNVKQSGDITGSQVLFTGGKIAGWTIEDDYIYKSISGSVAHQDFTRVYLSAAQDDAKNIGEGFTVYRKDEDTQAGETKIIRVGGLSTTTNLYHIEGEYGLQIIKKQDDGSGYENIVYFGSSTQQIAGWNISATQISASGMYMDSSNKKLVINSATFGGSGIQLEHNSGTPRAFIGKSGGGFLKFDGSNVQISSSTFLMGNDLTFISGSNGNIKISGSNIDVLTPKFYLGESSNYISGSNGNISIVNTGTTTLSGSAVDIKTPKFYLGESSNYISGSNGNISIVNTGTTTLSGSSITLQTPKFYLGESSQYISGSNGNIEISSSGFYLDNQGNVTLSGSITATSGEIGGASVSSDKLEFSPYWAISSSADTSDPVSFISSSAFKVSAGGNVTGSQVLFTGGKIANFTIDDHSLTTTGVEINDSTQTLFISSSELYITHTGVISGSQVLFTGGKIAGFTIATTGITSTGIGVHPTGQTYAFTAGNSNEFNVKHSGQITGSNVLFTGGKIGGFTVDTDEIKAGSTLILDSDSNSGEIKLGGASAIDTGDGIYMNGTGDAFRIGNAGASRFYWDGTDIKIDNSGGSTVVQLGNTNTIAGWSIDTSKIYSTNLYIRSSGVIETADFASDVQGWRLDSAGNGQAEFENVKVRGTLKTTVFEKESINAVGGQLYVANSTIISGSGVSPTDTTMSIANATGFTGSYDNNNGEILSIKKITDTGFNTEYVLVQSASRDEPSSSTNLAGKLYVVRGYSGSVAGDSSSLGGSPGAATSYSASQVIVSTGRSGSGYIRINANPNDAITPYIDIVERTGSAIYDVELKARLGDLSGLSSARLHGTDPSNAGFGLYSENVFLEGGIIANSGSIGGIKMQSSKLYAGTGTFGNTNTGFYLDSNSSMSLGDTFKWDGSNLNVTGSTVSVKTSNFYLGETAQYISGSNGNIEISSSGFHLSSTGEIKSKGVFRISAAGNVTASSILISSAIIVGGTANNFIGGSGSADQDGSLSKFNFIGGGDNHSIFSSTSSFIGGGRGNKIGSDISTAWRTNKNQDVNSILGGEDNLIRDGVGNVIVGGYGNRSGGMLGAFYSPGNQYSFIGAGLHNSMSRCTGSFIGGGYNNKMSMYGDAEIHPDWSSIVGGYNNTIEDPSSSFIGGGEDNLIRNKAHFSSIVGGKGNAIYNYATGSAIMAGLENIIEYSGQSFIGGGESNWIGTHHTRSGSWIAIVGGYNNTISKASAAFIGGGYGNYIASPIAETKGDDYRSDFSTIVGGKDNYIYDSPYSAVIAGGGGGGNKIYGSQYAFIGGGGPHQISGSEKSSIVAGSGNTILGSEKAFVGGGNNNDILRSTSSFIGGGENNSLTDSGDSVVVAGQLNTVSDCIRSFVGGGAINYLYDTDYTFLGNTFATTITASNNSFIGAGTSHYIKGGIGYNAIVGGNNNEITMTGSYQLGPGRNFIGGGQDNLIDVHHFGDTGGNALVGGYNAIVGGVDHKISSSKQSFIGGGQDNIIIKCGNSVIAGGGNNEIINTATGSRQNYSTNNFIGGGWTNTITGIPGLQAAGHDYEQRMEKNVIGGGEINKIQAMNHSFIGGGYGNEMISTGSVGSEGLSWFNGHHYNVIVGGLSNKMKQTNYSFIGSGRDNQIASQSYSNYAGGYNEYNAIVGGYLNKILNQTSPSWGKYNFIGNGYSNAIYQDANYSTIVNGYINNIYDGSEYATIVGGSYNQISGSNYSAILGGTRNQITGSDSIFVIGSDIKVTDGTSNTLYINQLELTGNISGSSTSTGSFAAVYVGGMANSNLVDVSSSYSTRVSNLKSDSGSFSTRVTNLVSDSGSFSTRVTALKLDSGSFSTRVTTNKLSGSILAGTGNIQGLGTTNNVQFNQITASDGIQVSGAIVPVSDDLINLGATSLRWADVFAVQTTTGGIFESGLKTKNIGDNPTGAIVVWRDDGLVPCDKNEDELVMGVIKNGKDEPIVLGAEPVLVTGKVDIGDYIVTSDNQGHGKSVKRGYLLKKDLFGKVIAQALEKSDDSDSCLIKCMIRKM